MKEPSISELVVIVRDDDDSNRSRTQKENAATAHGLRQYRRYLFKFLRELRPDALADHQIRTKSEALRNQLVRIMHSGEFQPSNSRADYERAAPTEVQPIKTFDVELHANTHDATRTTLSKHDEWVSVESSGDDARQPSAPVPVPLADLIDTDSVPCWVCIERPHGTSG